MRVPNHILIPQVAKMLRKGHTVTMQLRGRSMRPYLEDARDKALLAAVPKELHIGDVVLARISPGRYALHRIVAIKGKEITMHGDGNYAPEHVKRHEVVAIARGFYRKGSNKLEKTDGRLYTLYWKTWVALRPLRRYLLFLWKLYHYPKDTLSSLLQQKKTHSETATPFA